MIKITPTEVSGEIMKDFAYAEKRTLFSGLILRITRYLRSVNAEKYISPKQRILDIGCGDGYFLHRSKCTERYGIDKRTGDGEVTDFLDFPDEYFDYVTMLAVIEHISSPLKTLKEIHRVLKPDGSCIFTTPKKQADFFIRLYSKGITEEHKTYYNAAGVLDMIKGLYYISSAGTFLFGMNQIFCLKKIILRHE